MMAWLWFLLFGTWPDDTTCPTPDEVVEWDDTPLQ